MQSFFQFYLDLGFKHILDINGYDHIAYVVALCAVFSIAEWRKVLILVTAFTLGHSLTLALVGLEVIQLSAAQKTMVETLIPLTIIATALVNLFAQSGDKKGVFSFRFTYILTTFFGLIHGLGFSSFFRSSLMPEQGSGDLVQQLLAFNIGVELGQLIVVVVVLVLSYFLLNVLKLKQSHWVKMVSIVAILIAIYLLFG